MISSGVKFLLVLWNLLMVKTILMVTGVYLVSIRGWIVVKMSMALFRMITAEAAEKDFFFTILLVMKAVRMKNHRDYARPLLLSDALQPMTLSIQAVSTYLDVESRNQETAQDVTPARPPNGSVDP